MKSPSETPDLAIGKWKSGAYGRLSAEWSAGLPPFPAQARAMAKSPVWRGHIQLSISPPYSPTARGGA